VGVSSGTLATGQTVNQAHVALHPANPYLKAQIFGASFAKSAIGYRAIRYTALILGTRFAGANGPEVPALNIDNQHVQMVMQPGSSLVTPTDTNGQFVEVFQNSGGPLASTVDGLATPIIMSMWAAGA
jgi:hypothetical protein